MAQVEAGSDKPLSELLGEAPYLPLADLARPTRPSRWSERLSHAIAAAPSDEQQRDSEGAHARRPPR